MRQHARLFYGVIAVAPLGTAVSNLSLKLNTTGTFQVAKLLVTPSIVLLQFVMFGTRVSTRRILWLLLVLIGVGLFSVQVCARIVGVTVLSFSV